MPIERWLLPAIAAATLALATLLGPTAQGQFAAATLADYSGEELFQRFCASCHGIGARGDGPVAPTLRTVVPDLTTITDRYGEFRAGLIREVVDGRGVEVPAHGTREMPVWGYEFFVEDGADVRAEESVRESIERLVEYLRSIQRDPARVRAGRRN